MELIYSFASALVFLLLAIWFHELGHRKRAWSLGYEASIHLEGFTWGVPTFYTVWGGKGVNAEDTVKILKAGVFYGMAPLIFFTLFIEVMGLIPIFMAWILYLLGCRSDFNIIDELSL